MSVIQILPPLEVIILNSLSLDRCCHRKYSAGKTVAVLALFTCALAVFFQWLSSYIPVEGDGKLALAGFLYIIPLKALYKEEFPLLFAVMCACWVYTMGMFALALQIAAAWFGGNRVWFLFFINALLLLTLYPFHSQVIPKFVFIIENIRYFKKEWYKYLAASNCLNFLLLVVLSNAFAAGGGSPFKVLAFLMLLASIALSYFILYRIVLDSIRLNELEHVANHDPLTGLGNRAGLWKRLQVLLETDQEFTVLFMDLDHFKQINDRYGHLTGDRYLQHFAKISSRILADCGELYRFGGDEFIAVCLGTVSADTMDRLKKCREWEDGAPCPFNQVTTGLLLCRPPHPSLDQVLQKVDEIMYQNKYAKEY